MGKLFISNCIFLWYCVFFVQCQFLIYQDVENRIIRRSLPSILKFLNDDIGAKIIYNSGEIKRIQLKGDILEVDITASVTCKSSSEQCNYESADCRGILFIKPNVELQVLSVDCNPNSPMGEPIVLTVKDSPCEGCLVDIDVNGEGVEQLANNIVQHVESEKGKKYDLIKIVKVQTEVTNGVNFFLNVLIGLSSQSCGAQECNRDINEDVYCSAKFYQEPGYYSPKTIISNNCTQTQTFIPIIGTDESNDINTIHSEDKNGEYTKKDYYSKKSEISENDIFEELISQVIPLDKFGSKITKDMEIVEPNDDVHQDVEHNLRTSTDTIGQRSSIFDIVQQIPAAQVRNKRDVGSNSTGLDKVEVKSCSAQRIYCYECDSWTDQRCGHSLNQTALPKDQPPLMLCNGCCVKVIRNVGSAIEMIRRTCTTQLHVNIFIAGHLCMNGSDWNSRMCFCEDDLCNNSPKPVTSLSCITLVVVVISICLFTRPW